MSDDEDDDLSCDGSFSSISLSTIKSSSRRKCNDSSRSNIAASAPTPDADGGGFRDFVRKLRLRVEQLTTTICYQSNRTTDRYRHRIPPLPSYININFYNVSTSKRILFSVLAVYVVYFIHEINNVPNIELNNIQPSAIETSFDKEPSFTERIHHVFYSLSPFSFSSRKKSHQYTTINTKELTNTLSTSSHYTSTTDPNFDALQPPPGYPFHRWNDRRNLNSMSGYPLHVEKFVNILHRMGQGEMIKTTLEEGLNAQRSYHDFIRLSGSSYPYLVKQGKVLRPFGQFKRWKVYKWHSQGHHIDWVTLLESAVSMAKALEAKNQRMKLITEGEFPIIFDEFDYPWCADDLVPIFRLGSIVSTEVCTHQWPSLSLDYVLPQRKQWLKDAPIDWDYQFLHFNTQYPWESKQPLAVWRGRYSGYRDAYAQGVLPREQLVILASNNKDIMDVHPVSWKYYPDDQTGKLMQQSSYQLPFREFMKYRAVIDIDSNGASTRFGPLLCMNSVVIKVQPQFGGYWSHELEPWTHFIPVQADLSDLKTQVQFAISDKNQKQVQDIIENANDWCKRKMTWEQHTLDFLWTLLDYAELLDKAPRFNEKWSSDSFAYELPKLEMSEFQGELIV